MSKRKTEVKPIRAQRLKELIDAEGLTQTAFAKEMHYSQQLISGIINEKTALTEATAEEIASSFPKYSVEWLLGLSDYKNNAEAFRNSISKMNEEGQLLNTALVSIAALAGYNVRLKGIQNDSIEAAMSSLYYDYAEIEHEGTITTLSLEQLRQLQNIIYEHAEVSIRQFLKGVENYGKHTRKKK